MSDLIDRLRRAAATEPYGTEKLEEAADRIEVLEAAMRDARGYAALALDRPTLHNRQTLTSIIQALDRAALPRP